MVIAIIIANITIIAIIGNNIARTEGGECGGGVVRERGYLCVRVLLHWVRGGRDRGEEAN